MNNSNFCHLHLHSEYSVLDGVGTVDSYAKRASELGFKYLALTDHGSMNGLIEFQKACDKYDISPVLGCEAYIVPDATVTKDKKRGHILLLVKNQKGFNNLCRLLTYANLEGFYYRPRIDYNMLLNHCEGLVISTACCSSFLTKCKGGVEFFNKLLDEIGDDLYCEIMPHQMDEQIKINKLNIRLAKKSGSKIIVTNDCHYINRWEWKAQEVLLAIQTKAKWSDPKRWRFDIKGLYLRTANEMARSLKKIGFYKKEYLLNTIEVAEKCSGFRIPKSEVHLPRVRGVPLKEKEFLWSLCLRGYEDRFKNPIDNFYYSRLKEEYDLIVKKKFVRYFLIVWNLVKWCKENDILVGCGRGSVSGSLVSFLLGITAIDPIKHDLLFSRFINKDRIDYPDIDVDFEHDKRHLIKQHLETMYGRNHIANVSSFNRMKARAVIKDVGRVFDVPFDKVNSFTNLIEDNDEHTGIQNAIDNHQEGKDFDERYPEIVKIAKGLEGQIRSYSQHAAALIVSKEPLEQSERCNLLRRKDVLLINWEKNNAEYVGLMKLDALGLKLLSIFSEAIKLIKEERGQVIDLDKISIEDKTVLKEINMGNTVGLFQLNTPATTNLIDEVGIKIFNDLRDVVALVRPGIKNSGQTAEYIRRKHGGSWERHHEIYENITKDTYGVIVFQEQVMKVINEVAGLSYSTADKIRKIIGKKRNRKEFMPYKKRFIEGCLKQKTLSRIEAKEFWKGLEEHSKYSFNMCLAGDTIVTRPNGGRFCKNRNISIHDFYKKWEVSRSGGKYKNPKRGVKILQMDDDKRCRPKRVKNIYRNGIKKIFKIQTESGKSIKGTKNHRLLALKGYIEIKNLKRGDFLIVIGSRQKQEWKKRGQIWNITNTKGKKGFQKGVDNPAYVDGRRNLWRSIQEKVILRANEKCELCATVIKNERNQFEFAHIKLLGECDNDYYRYHSMNNVLYLCNSCHKQLDYKLGCRKKRYSKGIPVYKDKIISIKYAGKEMTYDLEMDSDNHNFIANGIVSHNSHSVAYALLGYQSAWLKRYYPTEFICASLTCGAKDKKSLLIEEAYRLGLSLALPKVGVSDAVRWIAKGDRLYVPFIEIRGVGPAKASEAANINTSRNIKKFFTKEKSIVKHGGALGKLLTEIGAYNLSDNIQIDDGIKSYFDFRIESDFTSSYKKLFDFFDNKIRLDRLDKILVGDSKELKKISKEAVKRISFQGHKKLIGCTACELREECRMPVVPSFGEYNIMIVGEAPGKEEDKQGIGFIGKAGELLWKIINKRGYERENFHITNINKCFPRISRRPNTKQIKACSRFLRKEIEEVQPVIILAFGNTSLQFFIEQKSGITGMSGKVTWNEEYGSFIVWCLHPAAVLYSPDNKIYFQKGMKSFFRLLRIIAPGIKDKY